MSVPKCLVLFFQNLEGLTEVFGRMSAWISGHKNILFGPNFRSETQWQKLRDLLLPALVPFSACAFKTRLNRVLLSPTRCTTYPKDLSVLEIVRDGPTTTTTIIFQKSFASDATPKRHLMAHQMKNLCGFSVFHCVEGQLVRHPGVPRKWKMGSREMSSKMVVVVAGPSLKIVRRSNP